MDKLYGYAGKLLRVDLSNEQITEERLDEETARRYIGGTGIGVKYLYEEVPAGVEWSDAANRLIIATGPLGGTAIGGSGTISVVTKGALTNGAVTTQANGFFGAFLRFAGYEGIIIQGKASRWVYLCIDKGKAELRDASHLVGKDTFETSDLIKAELGQSERGMSVTSIGPAGENLVKFAAIFVDKGHAAGHGGPGAVMGSKKLKAITVARGRGRPALKDKEGVSAIGKQFLDNVLNDPVSLAGVYTWGTLNGVVNSATARDGVIPVKNYTTTIYDIEPEKLEKYSGPYIRSHFEPKPSPCWGCRFHHCHMITITEGRYKGYVGEEPEYEAFAAFGPLIGVTDVTATIFLANEVERLGMEANEAGYLLGMAIECYEKGLLTRKDTDGIELTWGNYEAAHQMLYRIATRQGFGDVLAEGVMRAAQRIGGEAPNFAVHTKKGNTVRGHDHRTQWLEMFDTCVSNTSTIETHRLFPRKQLALPPIADFFSPDEVSSHVALTKGSMQFEDSLGVCRFNTNTNLKLLTQAVSAATGWDFSIEEAMQVGRRIVNMLRVFDIKHGHNVEMDVPSPRYGSTPVDGPHKGKSIMPHWDEMRRQYYELMGWDKETGKPLPDTLRRFGLEDTIPQLWEG